MIGRQIRVIDYNGEKYVPLVDLAEALEYDRSNLTSIISHNLSKFKEFIMLEIKTNGGIQSHRCIQKDDLKTLIILLRFDRSKKSHKEGFVYIIQSETGVIKIGQTKEIERRLNSYKTLPMKIKPLLIIKCKDRFATEKRLHGVFGKSRITGEWFHPRNVLITNNLFESLLMEGEECLMS